MPWSSPEKHRAYQHKYNATEEQKKRRAARNAARRDAVREYGAKALEGKDIDHKRSLDRGGDNEAHNLRPMSIRENRGFSRDKNNQPKR